MIVLGTRLVPLIRSRVPRPSLFCLGGDFSPQWLQTFLAPYYDFNCEWIEELRYMRRNPIIRGEYLKIESAGTKAGSNGALRVSRTSG